MERCQAKLKFVDELVKVLRFDTEDKPILSKSTSVEIVNDNPGRDVSLFARDYFCITVASILVNCPSCMYLVVCVH